MIAVYTSSLWTEHNRLQTKLTAGANEARELRADEMRLKTEWTEANRANERGLLADAPHPPRPRPALRECSPNVGHWAIHYSI